FCTRTGTNAFMELGLGWIGDKGISKVGKVTTLGEGVNPAKFSEGISSVSNQIPLKDRFAFADGSGMRSRFDAPDFKQAEEKLSTYQFARGVDTDTVKPGDTSPLAPGGGLNAHETKGGQRRGHLIKKHIGKTDAELLQRLQNDSRITGSSTFTDRATAEKIVATVLNNPRNQARIQSWLNSPRDNNLILRYHGTEIIGRGVIKGSTTVEDMSNAKIVLKKDRNGSFILTGYPL
ncbi:RNase A-like domain-containing protein, partial [Bacillus pseudomycoides]